MNSAKRVSNQTIKKNDKKSKNTPPADYAGKKNIIVFSIIGVALFLVISVVLWENLHPRLIFTVNGEKVYLSDMMTDIYMSESTGDYMDQLYKQNYGPSSSYWDAESNDGMTYGEILKDNTLESSMQREMMYQEAVEAGYTLSDEENATCEENAASLYDQLSGSVKNKTGLNKKKILQYYQKKTLADRYKADWIDTFDINDEALITEAGITKEDYRQYDIQYYYIPYTETDDQGNETPVSDDKKAEALKELEASYSDIAGLADFTTYIDNGTAESQNTEGTDNTAAPTDNAAENAGPKAPEGTNIKYTTKSFIEKDEPVFSEELTAQVKAMENGTVTGGVVEDEKGCYIIKMVENNSTERYDSECESVITDKENEEFQTKIEDLEVDKYLIELNDKEWDKVTFGKVTIN